MRLVEPACADVSVDKDEHLSITPRVGLGQPGEEQTNLGLATLAVGGVGIVRVPGAQRRVDGREVIDQFVVTDEEGVARGGAIEGSYQCFAGTQVPPSL